MGKAAGQDNWNILVKVNPIQVRDLLNHPVPILFNSMRLGNLKPKFKPFFNQKLKLKLSIESAGPLQHGNQGRGQQAVQGRLRRAAHAEG